ncbi:MAG: hypothetical protein QGG67_05055 [Gammaproteobacteria bacterium]|jgi:hypothetical protein|nr:hypothetical protein [Gammaproteobacteria bacterium]MDP6095347.1 hypothetical protein [Gammaproteobacteria bacterium]MDP7089554.1 hypothetical protein [Dehalococcoidia bacterium]|tara:strand:- start:422 stop:1522 length:1101 start_codon:yes stop_codon:yes gene_type:complete
MEAIRFECKSCGATVSARDGIAVCEYCGGKHKISYSSNDIDIELLRKVEAQDTKIDGIVGAIGVKKERDKEVKKLKKLRRKLSAIESEYRLKVAELNPMESKDTKRSLFLGMLKAKEGLFKSDEYSRIYYKIASTNMTAGLIFMFFFLAMIVSVGIMLFLSNPVPFIVVFLFGIVFLFILLKLPETSRLKSLFSDREYGGKELAELHFIELRHIARLENPIRRLNLGLEQAGIHDDFTCPKTTLWGANADDRGEDHNHSSIDQTIDIVIVDIGPSHLAKFENLIIWLREEREKYLPVLQYVWRSQLGQIGFSDYGFSEIGVAEAMIKCSYATDLTYTIEGVERSIAGDLCTKLKDNNIDYRVTDAS